MPAILKKGGWGVGIMSMWRGWGIRGALWAHYLGFHPGGPWARREGSRGAPWGAPWGRWDLGEPLGPHWSTSLELC